MNVFFFGDSIFYGAEISPHKSWVTRLSAVVEEAFGDRYVVVNSSINGNTTRMALERIAFDVQSHGLLLMVVQFGLNDCNRWQTDSGHPRVSPEPFRHNLIEIVERARTFGALEVLLSTNHPTLRRLADGSYDSDYQVNLQRYNEIIREVSEAQELVGLIDVEAAFDRALSEGEQLETFVVKDGVHLTLKGNDFYFDLVKPHLLASLSRIEQRVGLGTA